jgi:hypothetical protein
MIDRKGLLALGASQTCLFARVEPGMDQPTSRSTRARDSHRRHFRHSMG